MVDEQELLEQFTAKFAHESTQTPGAGTAHDDGDNGADKTGTFDTNAFLHGLDAIFERHAGETEAEPYLEQAMADAENAGDDAGLLTVLNEAMGFYRSQSMHDKNQWIVQRTIELAARMGLAGTEAWATTLINCATAMRAAGQYDQAEDLYTQALDCANRVFAPTDRRLAALHNNLSMLYSETGRPAEAQQELETALHILTTSSPDPSQDIDVASTHTNLALLLLGRAQGGRTAGRLSDAHDAGAAPSDAAPTPANLLAQADRHATAALDIYAAGHLQQSSHYASALAGLAQVRYAEGRYAEAVDGYRQALAVIEDCYGRDTDYYRVTEANLRQAEAAARKAGQTADRFIGKPDTAAEQTADKDAGAPVQPAENPAHTMPVDASEPARSGPVKSAASAAPTTPAAPAPTALRTTGMELARRFWTEQVRPMIAERYPEQLGRVAAGLVGHGSECYGFDDALSEDHDFGPRCCLWLTDEDYASFGERLQADYDALKPTPDADATTPRAQGSSRRDGVFRIGDFFESITGYRQAPPADRPHEWLMLDEATLAAATNGAVFADPVGAFSAARQAFKDMPEDVRLALISRRLGMMAQAGQYNLPRMLARGDGAAAMLSITEFTHAAASLVFLLNQPITVGYLPYYKWQFAALRQLSGRMATRLAGVCDQLESMLRLASAACYGGAGFGEGGKGAQPAADTITDIVEQIAQSVVAELRREGLTRSSETFLEWQRPYLEEHIESADPVLHSL